MPSIKAIQQIIDELRTGSLSDSECVTLLHHPSPVVRANAIDAISTRVEGKGELIDELMASVVDSANGVRLMGTTNVSDVAVCALLRTRQARAVDFVREYIASLCNARHADLMAYLASEDVDITL